MEPVTRDRFDAFLSAYPRRLVREVLPLRSMPPVVLYTDPTKGPFPQNVMASYVNGPPEGGQDGTASGWRIRQEPQWDDAL